MADLDALHQIEASLAERGKTIEESLAEHRQWALRFKQERQASSEQRLR